MRDDTVYHSSEQLSLRLGISSKRLRELADRGEIPSLRLGKQRRFSKYAVERALERLAERQAKARQRPEAAYA